MHSRSAKLLCLLLLAMNVVAGGCRSRWARDDVDYAAKYSRHSDDPARIAKQAIDARHVKGKYGPYAGMSGRAKPFALGGEAGVFNYPTSYLEVRGGLGGLIYEGDTPLSAGVTAGARLQTPTRLAPFVGLGGYLGGFPSFEFDDDGVDNDHDGLIDEADESDENDVVVAASPEAGVHFWLTPQWRLTASASYMAVIDGDVDSFPTYSVSLARLTGLGVPTSQRGLVKAAQDGGWKVGDGASAAEHASQWPLETSDAIFEAPPEPLPAVEE